jgi:hypothetical protein
MNTHRFPRRPHFLHLGALPLLVSAGVLAGACGGSDDSSTSTATTAASSSSGSGGSSSSSSTSSTGGGGEGGQAMNPDPCNPVVNDCVEADASKCTITLDEDKYATTICEAPPGDQQLGEDCVRPDGLPGHDTCAAGLYCVSWLKPVSDPQLRACADMCDETNPCAADGPCVQIATNPYGVCLDTCEPFDGVCTADPTRNCVVFTDINSEAVFACAHAGPKAALEACQFNTDCAQEHSCRSGVCRPFCDNAHPCSTPSDGCLMPTDQPTLGLFGNCVQANDSCLGTLVVPPAPSPTADLSVLAFDLFQGNVVEGAAVKACAANDVNCAAPLAQGVTDAGGSATLTVPTPGLGFDGYFEITAPGYAVNLAYYNFPLGKTGDYALAYLASEASIVSGFVGSPVADPTRGMIIAAAFDCDFNSHGGSVFSIASSDASTVLGHGLPTFSAATLSADVADPALTSSPGGGMLALNVPVGITNVAATAYDGTPIGNRDVVFRAGALTTLLIGPVLPW